MNLHDMTIDERISRDGDRWRYVYYLEREIEARQTRIIGLRISLIANVIMFSILVLALA